MPTIERVLSCLGRQGLLVVGDGKMSALATRAYLEAYGQYYLTLLALVGETGQQMPQWIEAGVAQGERLTAVLTEDGKQTLAQGYEVSRTCVCGELSWSERVLVGRSQTYVQTQRRHLEERRAFAEQARLSLTPKVGTGQTPDHGGGAAVERGGGHSRQASWEAGCSPSPLPARASRRSNVLGEDGGEPNANSR